MAIMKDKLLELLKDKSMTVDEITDELNKHYINFDNSLKVMSLIMELENENKVMLDSTIECYEPNGRICYIGKYKLV